MAFPHCDVNDLEGLLWTHVSLLSLCVILILASFNSQFREPAPYGRHADPAKAKAWGFPIPQRVGHIVSDAIPGLPVCLMVYLLYAGMLPAEGGRFSEVRSINIVLLCGWLLHYLYRGIVHPLIMPYSSRTVAVGITLAGIFPNLLFSYLIAVQLACTAYPDDWATDPRFIIGVVLYGVGTAINRWADLKLRAGRLARMGRRRAGGPVQEAVTPQGGQRDSLGAVTGAAAVGGSGGGDGGGESAQAGMREGLLMAGGGSEAEGPGGSIDRSSPSSGATRSVPPLEKPGGQDRRQEQNEGEAEARVQPLVRSQYFIPRGGLFELVSCPNYLGELVEWTGYALAVWSWPALAWALFGASTFVPRAITNHRWYKHHFGEEYPPGRRALIPFVL